MKSWTRKGYLSPWCNAVVADLTQLRPLNSASIKVEPIPGHGVMFHAVSGRGTGAAETAWQHFPGFGEAHVSHGPVMWDGQLVNADWTDNTALFGTPESVAYPVITDDVWLYVEAALLTGAVACHFSANNVVPADDAAAYTLRRPLSLWRFVTTGGVTTGGPVFTMPGSPFPGDVAAILGRPAS